MRGDIVIIRTYGDIPLVRRLWDENGKGIVYITNDEQFQLLIDGKEALEPIGFHERMYFNMILN